MKAHELLLDNLSKTVGGGVTVDVYTIAMGAIFIYILIYASRKIFDVIFPEPVEFDEVVYNDDGETYSQKAYEKYASQRKVREEFSRRYREENR